MSAEINSGAEVTASLAGNGIEGTLNSIFRVINEKATEWLASSDKHLVDRMGWVAPVVV